MYRITWLQARSQDLREAAHTKGKKQLCLSEDWGLNSVRFLICLWPLARHIMEALLPFLNIWNSLTGIYYAKYCKKAEKEIFPLWEQKQPPVALILTVEWSWPQVCWVSCKNAPQTDFPSACFSHHKATSEQQRILSISKASLAFIAKSFQAAVERSMM